MWFKFASLITPQLYISDYWTAHNNAKLKELGITQVISLFAKNDRVPDLQEYDIPADRRLHIDIADSHYADILKHLEMTTAFITAAIGEDKNTKVLVCQVHSARILSSQLLMFVCRCIVWREYAAAQLWSPRIWWLQQI